MSWASREFRLAKGVVWARWKLDWLDGRRKILIRKEGSESFIEAGLVPFMRKAYETMRSTKKRLRRVGGDGRLS